MLLVFNKGFGLGRATKGQSQGNINEATAKAITFNAKV